MCLSAALVDVDAAVGGRDLVDALVDGVFAGDVHRHAHRLAASLLDFAGNGVGAGLIQVGDRNGRACACKRQGHLLADTAGGAGHDGDFSIQLAHAATSGSEMPAGPRMLHRGGAGNRPCGEGAGAQPQRKEHLWMVVLQLEQRLNATRAAGCR
ncbi:hypothetical protein G6F68_014136 [Rhizopus microsporus]|nr:hypothetical protein G6F68_014136 [Rhizopus microsporus]